MEVGGIEEAVTEEGTVDTEPVTAVVAAEEAAAGTTAGLQDGILCGLITDFPRIGGMLNPIAI